jgi:hypothetical protein
VDVVRVHVDATVIAVALQYHLQPLRVVKLELAKADLLRTLDIVLADNVERTAHHTQTKQRETERERERERGERAGDVKGKERNDGEKGEYLSHMRRMASFLSCIRSIRYEMARLSFRKKLRVDS